MISNVASETDYMQEEIIKLLNDESFVPKTSVEIECHPISLVKIGEALFQYIAEPFPV